MVMSVALAMAILFPASASVALSSLRLGFAVTTYRCRLATLVHLLLSVGVDIPLHRLSWSRVLFILLFRWVGFLRPSVFRLPTLQRGGLVLVRAKVALGCTKRSRSQKSVARVSGFRVRMSTTDERNVIKRRRAKGRKKLVPASNPNSGQYA